MYRGTWRFWLNARPNARVSREISSKHGASLNVSWRCAIPSAKSHHLTMRSRRHKFRPCSGVKLAGHGATQVIMTGRGNAANVANRSCEMQTSAVGLPGQGYVFKREAFPG